MCNDGVPVGAVEEAEHVPADVAPDVVPQALLHQLVGLVDLYMKSIATE